MEALILVVVGGLILTVGDIVMKGWVDTNNNYWFVLGIFLYTVSMCLLALLFKIGKNIAVASVLMETFNIVTLIIVSWFVFHEKLSALQMVGCLLGLASVIVLEIAN
ncbi:MAG TPA: hypothetical protein DCP90_09405 [Clostridiales bacterium]|nr:MAG: hypothetical protein A2Y22_01450 [Clostridiales bacterium GWD2_32_59]HAN10809.1 hypothetical protein [Clostridiales bacterium]